MENFVVRFDESKREAVLDILARNNDIIINKVEPNSVLITIQLDNAEAAYEELLEQIRTELQPAEVVIIRVETIVVPPEHTV